MSHIVNVRSRTEAYLKFMIFFIVTVLLILAAVYFDVRFPIKELNILKDRNQSYQSQVNTQIQFTSATRRAKVLIDSMSKLKTGNALLDREIAKELELINSPIYQGKNIYASTNKEVFNALYDYWELTKKSLESKTAIQQMEKWMNESKEWEAKYKDAEDKLDVYRKTVDAGF